MPGMMNRGILTGEAGLGYSKTSLWGSKLMVFAGVPHQNFETVAQTLRYYGLPSVSIDSRKPFSHLFSFLKKVGIHLPS